MDLNKKKVKQEICIRPTTSSFAFAEFLDHDIAKNDNELSCFLCRTWPKIKRNNFNGHHKNAKNVA